MEERQPRHVFSFLNAITPKQRYKIFFSLQVHKEGTPILNLAANYNIVICHAKLHLGVAQWSRMHLINYMNDTRALEEMSSNNLERTN